MNNNTITVEVTVNISMEKAWEFWTKPGHITKWYQASDDWHAPHAKNDLRVTGKFKTTMAAKDGSNSFDFEGVYTKIQRYQLIEYTLLDGRKVRVSFFQIGKRIKIVESFEPENTNPPELQRDGWQAILESFKRYAEALG